MFSKHPDGKYGKQTRCKECDREYSKQRSAKRGMSWPAKNPEKFLAYRLKNREKIIAQRKAIHAANPDRKWGKDLKKKYGLSIEDYKAMLASNGGLCFLCGKPERSIDHRTRKVKRLAVDHHHETNKVRGLLCSHCNRAIGLFHDDADLLTKAGQYLRSFE